MYYQDGLIVLSKNERPTDLIRRVWHTKVMNRNENVIVSIVGKTGSGKTYAALSLACMFPGFHRDNIVFTSKEFFRLVNSGKLKKGSVIIYDEAEVDLDNLTFWDKLVRFFGYMMSTIRSRNYIIIFTMPYKDDVAKKIRRLIHYTIVATGIKNKSKGYSICKIYELSANYARGGKIYDKFIRVKKGKVTYVLKKLKLKLPPKEVIKYYEAMKHEYVGDLYNRMEQDMLDNEVSLKSLTPKQELVYNMFLVKKPETLKDACIAYFDMYSKKTTPQDLSKIRKAFRNKGYTLTTKDEDYMTRLTSRVELTMEKERQVEVLSN